jgi:hypothetical protein
MEFPIEFFLDYAWNPAAWPAERLDEYTRQWAAEQFGNEHAAAIADILDKYTRYNSRRKPELLAPDTYSLANYREAEMVVADYNRLLAEAERINGVLPAEDRDAYFQLVLHPVEACANLNELYFTVAKNRQAAEQGRATTNDLAKHAEELFAKDAEISRYYNRSLAGGKWSHMMDQTHIGYTYWQEPPNNTLPKVKRLELPPVGSMGVAVEGSERWWPGDARELVLQAINSIDNERRYIEVFNRGQAPLEYNVAADAPWLRIDLDPECAEARGKLEKEQRLWVSVDWAQAPAGSSQIPITITGADGQRIVVQTSVNKQTMPVTDDFRGFIESDGYISMEAEHFTNAVAPEPIRWQRIPGLGRTLSGMTPVPTTVESQTPGGDSPRLEYRMYLHSGGPVKVGVFASPSLRFHDSAGLRYAVSCDDQPPQIVNLHAGENLQVWEKWVADNINLTVTEHELDGPGEHVLTFWMVDPGVVLQKLVVDAGHAKPSYLGPPESIQHPAAESEKQ